MAYTFTVVDSSAYFPDDGYVEVPAGGGSIDFMELRKLSNALDDVLDIN